MTIEIVDSLKLDYIVVGSGFVNQTGKSFFVNNLSFKLININTLETDMSGIFEGPSVRIAGVAKRLGKKMVRAVK